MKIVLIAVLLAITVILVGCAQTPPTEERGENNLPLPQKESEAGAPPSLPQEAGGEIIPPIPG